MNLLNLNTIKNSDYWNRLLRGISATLVTVTSLATIQPPSVAQVDCASVEKVGRSRRSSILSEMNNRAAGETYTVGENQTLTINNIEEVYFKDCRLTVITDITVGRKYRRDANGTVTIIADIDSLDFEEGKLCYKNRRVTKFNLSNTLGYGEASYRWIAQKTFPDQGCFNR